MLPLLLDCDGVLADFSGAVCAELGIDPSGVTTSDYFKRGEHREAFLNLCRFSPLWRELDPLPGAREAVGDLRRAGVPIVVVTAPWHSNQVWGGLRYAWLKRHFGIKPADVVITSRKDLVQGCALVEDRPDTLWEWNIANPTRPTYLFDQPYNQHDDGGATLRSTWVDGLAPRIIRLLESTPTGEAK